MPVIDTMKTKQCKLWPITEGLYEYSQLSDNNNNNINKQFAWTLPRIIRNLLTTFIE